MIEFNGASAVVTGAGSGLGREVARALAARGASVVVADINEAGIDETVAEVERAGGVALGVRTDVTRQDDLDQLRDHTIEVFGKIDLLINNAAVLVVGLPTDIPLQEWERVLSINLLSVVRSVHAFVPTMIAQGAGHILNVSSTAGLWPYAYDRLPYAASKAAVIALSEGLGLYLRPLGIGVTCFAPGGVAGGRIIDSVRYFGERQPVRGAGLKADAVQDVARMIIEAIREDAVLKVPSDEIRQIVLEHHADPTAFTAKQLERIARGDHIIAAGS